MMHVNLQILTSIWDCWVYQDIIMLNVFLLIFYRLKIKSHSERAKPETR